MLSVNAKSGEVYLYGVVGGGMFEDGFTESDVLKALSDLGNKRATVRINSPGGSADQGISIYNALKRHKYGVDTVVDSLAASAASVIALAGEKRTSSIGSRWMIHRAMTFEVGNANRMRKTADVLEKYDDSLIEIYSQYMAADDIKSLLEAETWYTADEAMQAGLATEVDGKTDAKPAIAAWFENPPDDLVEQAVKNTYSAKFKILRSKLVDLAV